LREIKNGENVVVTDRGNPVAIMHRLDKIEENAGLDERLAALAAQGHLRLPTCKNSSISFTPIILDGEALFETLIRERR
jgi:hypothetical protein